MKIITLNLLLTVVTFNFSFLFGSDTPQSDVRSGNEYKDVNMGQKLNQFVNIVENVLYHSNIFKGFKEQQRLIILDELDTLRLHFQALEENEKTDNLQEWFKSLQSLCEYVLQSSVIFVLGSKKPIQEDVKKMCRLSTFVDEGAKNFIKTNFGVSLQQLIARVAKNFGFLENILENLEKTKLKESDKVSSNTFKSGGDVVKYAQNSSGLRNETNEAILNMRNETDEGLSEMYSETNEAASSDVDSETAPVVLDADNEMEAVISVFYNNETDAIISVFDDNETDAVVSVFDSNETDPVLSDVVSETEAIISDVVSETEAIISDVVSETEAIISDIGSETEAIISDIGIETEAIISDIGSETEAIISDLDSETGEGLSGGPNFENEDIAALFLQPKDEVVSEILYELDDYNELDDLVEQN